MERVLVYEVFYPQTFFADASSFGGTPLQIIDVSEILQIKGRQHQFTQRVAPQKIHFSGKVKLDWIPRLHENQSANLGFTNPNSLVDRKWLVSVCFTETPVDHVHLQCEEIAGRQLHFQPYGLAFFEDSVRKRRGNPIFYVETTNQLIRSAWDQIPTLPNCADFKGIMPLVEGFGPPWYQTRFSPTEIDFRWEREWRVPGHFKFHFTDVAFGLCETAAIPPKAVAAHLLLNPNG